MAFDPLRISIDRERAKPRAECLVLGMGQMLVVQIQHLVVVKRLLEVLERLFGQSGRRTPAISAPIAADSGFTSK